jgi:hypothetical protein
MVCWPTKMTAISAAAQIITVPALATGGANLRRTLAVH